MTKEEILGKLASREPLFNSFPTPAKKRIMGIEVEYGMGFDMEEIFPANQSSFDEELSDFVTLERWQTNGGKIYADQKHLEGCTPEVSNPLEAVCFMKAMERLCREVDLPFDLFANNRDTEDNSFGCHENYFCLLNENNRPDLIPFLIARTVIIGSGFFNLNKTFKISQRAEHIKKVRSEGTVADRGLIGSRISDPTIPPYGAWNRLHLISGDTNMCEMASFLKIGLTSLAIEMIEMGEMPMTNFNSSHCIRDLHNLSHSTSNWIVSRNIEKRNIWKMESLGGYPVLEYLSEFIRKARDLFFGRDEITSTLITIAEDTLLKLERDLFALVGRIDWITKLWLYRTLYKDSGKSIDIDVFHQNDVEYHNIDTEKSLFYYLDQEGYIEKLLSPKLITHAKEFAPRDTRAYIRGRFVRGLKKRGDNMRESVGWSVLNLTKNRNIQIQNPQRTYKDEIDRLNEFFT